MKKQTRYLISLLLTLATLSLAACNGQEPLVETPPTDSAPLITDVPTEIPAATDAPAGEGAAVSFAQDILPILQENCPRCHGTSRQSADLKLNTHENLMLGSEDGAVVIPGNSAESILLEMIRAGAMPKGGTKLSDADIQLIADWIDAGAPDN